MPSHLLLSWVFIHDAAGIFMPWISTTPQSLLSYVQRISVHDNSNAPNHENFQRVPLLARPLQKSMYAVMQVLKDGIVTHVKSHIGHISTLHGMLPTHPIACQSKTANYLTLPKFIEDGTITPTVLYCVSGNPDGSAPSLKSIQRFGIMPGDLSNSEVVKALQEKPDGNCLLATRLLPTDTKWLFPNTLAVVEISLRALVDHARVDVHPSENGTFHVSSQIPSGTITGIRSPKDGCL